MAANTDTTDPQQICTALVVSSPRKAAKLRIHDKPLMLQDDCWTFLVPEDAVCSVPKGPNNVASIDVVRFMLLNASPVEWERFCDPDRLMLLKGAGGSGVYTTFRVIDDHGRRVDAYAYQVPPSVCDAVFPEWQRRTASRIPENERQQARLDILKWRSTDGGMGVVPHLSGWERWRVFVPPSPFVWWYDMQNVPPPEPEDVSDYDSDASDLVEYSPPAAVKRLLGEAMSELDELVENGDIKEGAYNSLSKRLKTLHEANASRQKAVERAEQRLFIGLAIENPHLLAEETGSVPTFSPAFLGELFVVRRNECDAWTLESEESWFGSILSFYLPADAGDENTAEDLEHFSDGVFTILHALRRNMARNTKLAMEKCCEWLVENLKSKGLSAAEMFETEQMVAVYGISEKNTAIRNWMFESATTEQQEVIDKE
jgi:hypothetical protein